MLKKKKFPSLYHQNNGILKALVTITSFNQALNSKSSKKEYNTHHSTQQTTTKQEGGEEGRAEGREVSYWDISNNRP